MRGTRISIASFVLLAGLAFAASPDYLPLETGNQWIYRAAGRPETFVVEVVRAEVMNGRVYSVVRGLQDGEVWLRIDDGGTMYGYDPDSRREGVFAAFGAPEGSEYDSVIGPCNRRARLVSRNARYEGPVGQFTTALRIAYPPGACADAGITEEFYLPWVGLVRRTLTTIAGPVTYDLIYAQLGGVTVISGSELSFGVALDSHTYVANLMPPVDPRRAVPSMVLRMNLRNWTAAPLAINFPSGQSYDVVIRNARDEVVYRWSEGKAFIQVFRQERLEPRRERNYVVTVRLADKEDRPLPAGRYTAEAWLATEGGKRYAATAGFEIQHVF